MPAAASSGKAGSLSLWRSCFSQACVVCVCVPAHSNPPHGWLVGIPALVCNYGSSPGLSALLLPAPPPCSYRDQLPLFTWPFSSDSNQLCCNPSVMLAVMWHSSGLLVVLLNLPWTYNYVKINKLNSWILKIMSSVLFPSVNIQTLDIEEEPTCLTIRFRLAEEVLLKAFVHVAIIADAVCSCRGRQVRVKRCLSFTVSANHWKASPFSISISADRWWNYLYVLKSKKKLILFNYFL